MDIYLKKIDNLVKGASERTIKEIRYAISQIDKTFTNQKEKEYVMSRLYNNLHPKQRFKLQSDFGATINIPANPVATTTVPPPISAPTPVVQPQVQQAQPAAIPPTYQQSANLANLAAQVAQQATQVAALNQSANAAMVGQGAFGYSKQRFLDSTYVTHGDFFNNSYISL